MNITIGQTTKSVNSTSRVFVGGGTSLTGVKLKEPCSMQSPVFLLSGITKNKLYNFLKWNGNSGDIDRYYWIDDIVFQTNDIVEVHCHLDPLATFREAILNDDYYVLYGPSTHWNQWVDDPRFQPEKQNIYSNFVKSFALFNDASQWAHSENKIRFDKDGSILIRVMETASLQDIQTICNTVTSVVDHQGINTYLIKYSQMKNWINDMSVQLGEFCSAILGIPTLTDIEKLIQCACKFWGNISGAGSWRDNLISVTYLPLKFDDLKRYGTSASYFCCGGVPCGLASNGGQLDIYQMDHQIEIQEYYGAVDIPWDTDNTAKPDYSDLETHKFSFLRNRRWYMLQLYTPGGYCEIDMQELKEQTTLTVYTALNIMTGEWTMRVCEGTNNKQVLASFGGCIGVDLTEFVGSADNLSNQANNVMNKIGSTIASVAMKTNVMEAGQTLSNFNSAPVRSLSENQASQKHMISMELASKYNSAMLTDRISDGIMGNFSPSGINPACPSAGMSGNLSSLFLTETFGQCYFVGIQYIPVDIAHYGNFCTKHGFPVNKWLNLNTEGITGYVKCAGAYIDYIEGASVANISTINTYLNSGINIEM